MKTLGLRCSPKEYSFVVLDGDRDTPALVESGTNPIPAGYSRPELLGWFYQEIEDLCRRSDVKALVVKGAEPMATKDGSFVERVELEAVAFLVSKHVGIPDTARRVNATIAKLLGMKGRASYLKKMDTSKFPALDSLPVKEREAALAAWTNL